MRAILLLLLLVFLAASCSVPKIRPIPCRYCESRYGFGSRRTFDLNEVLPILAPDIARENHDEGCPERAGRAPFSGRR